MDDAGGQRREFFHPLIQIRSDLLGAAVSNTTSMRGDGGKVLRVRRCPGPGAVAAHAVANEIDASFIETHCLLKMGKEQFEICRFPGVRSTWSIWQNLRQYDEEGLGDLRAEIFQRRLPAQHLDVRATLTCTM